MSAPAASQGKDRGANRRVAVLCLAVAAGMVGLSYASVPLYRLFCQVTGYGGTTQRAAEAPKSVIGREVVVEFDANTSPALPWSFEPAQRRVTVKLGEQALAFYRAVNKSDAPVRGQAVFNVTPDEVGRYFTKIECFCFTEQELAPHQSVDMPVLFYVDPGLADDPDLKSVRTLTLSYTFYPVPGEKVSDAPQGPGNGVN
jgi:cytochrome c oxidase assembly protein subunit 11